MNFWKTCIYERSRAGRNGSWPLLHCVLQTRGRPGLPLGSFWQRQVSAIGGMCVSHQVDLPVIMPQQLGTLSSWAARPTLFSVAETGI